MAERVFLVERVRDREGDIKTPVGEVVTIEQIQRAEIRLFSQVVVRVR